MTRSLPLRPNGRIFLVLMRHFSFFLRESRKAAAWWEHCKYVVYITLLKETIALNLALYFVKIRWDYFSENLALNFEAYNIIWNPQQNVNKPKHWFCSNFINRFEHYIWKFVKAKNSFQISLLKHVQQNQQQLLRIFQF